MTQRKHFWLVPLLLAAVVGAVGWWADGQLRHTIEQELRSDLRATLAANVTALEIWMENQKRMAASLAEEPRFRAAALQLLERTGAGETNRTVMGELSRQLISSEKLQERLRTLGYGMAQVVSTNLTVVADTARGRGRPGGPVLEELQPKFHELFASGEPVLITPFKVKPPEPPRFGGREGFRRPPPTNSFMAGANPSGPPGRPGPPRGDMTVMQVAAPVKDSAGVTRGALALVLNPDAEFTRILSVARSGDSGETIAFDAEGLLISKSRFDNELKQLKLLKDDPAATSALTLTLHDPGGDLAQGFVPATNATWPLIEMVQHAIAGGAGVQSESFRDYRGVEVVGAWQWLPKYGFGVGAKIDAREAYQSLRVVRGVFLILFLLLVVASLVVLVFSYQHLIWRRRVTEAELKARQLGQYKILEKIGQGGMGVVYRAHHALLRRETALKLLPLDRTDELSVARFEQEVRLTCRLTHPNTIQVYDYGHTPDGIFYYAMEYLDGLNLHQLVARYGAQPEERVIFILRQICDSLAEAHALGLIHRDIKPGNVFLCDRGGLPDSVKVLDFGLVKHFGAKPDEAVLVESFRDGDMVGTPNFIAPETLRDPNQCEARSDLYAVGALGYFLLTAREVFDCTSVADLCQQHLHATPQPPGQRAGKAFDQQLEALLLRCLAKAPTDRPQSAREMGDVLAALSPADRWSLSRRMEWWRAHRQSTAAAPTPTVAGVSSPEKTVKIEFADRTP